MQGHVFEQPERWTADRVRPVEQVAVHVRLCERTLEAPGAWLISVLPASIMHDNLFNGSLPENFGDMTSLHYLYVLSPVLALRALADDDRKGLARQSAGRLGSIEHGADETAVLPVRVVRVLRVAMQTACTSHVARSVLLNNRLSGSLPETMGNMTALVDMYVASDSDARRLQS